MDEIQVWLVLASATSEFHKIQIFYHNNSHLNNPGLPGLFIKIAVAVFKKQ